MHGARQLKLENERSGRKCRAHPYQVAIPASKKFASDSGEKDGRWSEMIVLIMQISDQDVTQILSLYNDLVYYSKASFCVFTPRKCCFQRKDLYSNTEEHENHKQIDYCIPLFLVC